MAEAGMAEPRRTSLIDLMVLIAGIAVGCAYEPDYLTRTLSLTLFPVANRPIQILALGIAAAILVRRVRHGGMPRDAEWPALVLAAGFASAMIVNHFHHVSVCGAKVPCWSPTLSQGVLFLALFRGRLPAWIRMIWIVALSALLMAGPLHVYFDKAAQMLVRLTYTGSLHTGAYQHYLVRWLRWLDGSRWPELLLYAVPATAACRAAIRNGRAAWAWTEWAGLGLVLAWSAAWCLDYASVDFTSAAERLSTVGVRGAVLAGIAAVSWLIVQTVGPRLGALDRPGSNRFAPRQPGRISSWGENFPRSRAHADRPGRGAPASTFLLLSEALVRAGRLRFPEPVASLAPVMHFSTPRSRAGVQRMRANAEANRGWPAALELIVRSA